jgi:glycosyltransferase involved in cell wall biosynthesis
LSEIRILILTHCFPADHSDIPGNFLPDLCGELSQLGAKVTVLTQKMEREVSDEIVSNSHARIEFFKWSGGETRFADLKLKTIRGIRSVFSLIRNGRSRCKELIRELKPDLILNCWAVPSGLWSYGLYDKKRSAVWALGSDISVYSVKPVFRKIVGRILSSNGTVFVNSVSLKEKITQIHHLSSRMLYTARPIPAPSKPYENSETLRLAFIGRLEKIKGPDILLSAVKLSGIENYRLTFVGSGSMKTELQKYCNSNGMRDKVSFAGMKNATEISDILAGSDYLVISSISESMPVVFWEAMQTGTPVLATDVGDLGYYCEKYNVGRVCQSDERSLSELLLFSYGFKPLRNVLSAGTVEAAKVSSIASSAQIIYQFACKKLEN